MISFGSTQIATNIMLAPLSGCSDLAFRLTARECGTKFCFFEMVDAHSMLSPQPKKFDILRTVARDTPIAAQLVGSDPAIMLEAAHILLDHVRIPFLDINSACPVKKVLKKGAGAALLKNPHTLFRILATLVSSCQIPITIKLRIGFHQPDIPVLLDLVKACEAHGAAALFIHGRTRDQGYHGDINYDAIRFVKHAVKIPVFGSGNIFTPQSAKHMLDETDCDGVLVARGAFGNPWLPSDIEAYLQHDTLPPERPLSDKKAVLQKHLSYIAEYKHNSPAGKIGFMRKVALWYLKGFPNAAKIRGQINTVPDYATLLQFIEQYVQEQDQPESMSDGNHSEPW